jgi:hypothetical protein
MVSEGRTIEEVDGDVWVCQMQLGADGGSRRGRQSKAAGSGLSFFGMGHVLGL